MPHCHRHRCTDHYQKTCQPSYSSGLLFCQEPRTVKSLDKGRSHQQTGKATSVEKVDCITFLIKKYQYKEIKKLSWSVILTIWMLCEELWWIHTNTTCNWYSIRSFARPLFAQTVLAPERKWLPIRMMNTTSMLPNILTMKCKWLPRRSGRKGEVLFCSRF